MGNFYCNFTVSGASREDVVRILTENRRTAFISPTVRGRTIVYERASDGLDPRDITALGTLLSRELDRPALGAVVADGDGLWLGLFVEGELRTEYSSRGQNHGAVAVTRAFGRVWMAPILWFILQPPWLLFECFRHMLVAKILGIPAWWAVRGYRYIEEGEPPHGLTEDELLRTGRS